MRDRRASTSQILHSNTTPGKQQVPDKMPTEQLQQPQTKAEDTIANGTEFNRDSYEHRRQSYNAEQHKKKC